MVRARAACDIEASRGIRAASACAMVAALLVMRMLVPPGIETGGVAALTIPAAWRPELGWCGAENSLSLSSLC